MHSDPRSFRAALRSAWRSLRRTPGFLAIAVSSLAIALGLATAVIAQIDALISPRSPIRDADRLFTADYILADSRLAGAVGGYPTFDEMRARLSRLAAIEVVELIGERIAPYSAGTMADDVIATVLTPAAFAELGVRPRLGRSFAADEMEESGVVIVTHEFWTRHFENARSIGTATVTFDGRVHSVVGVLPSGLNDAGFGGLFIPSRPGAEPDRKFLVRTLEPSSVDDVRDALNAISGELALLNPGTRRRIPPFRVHSVKPDPLGLRELHKAMLGAAVFVLLIACANVSALMLARGVARRRNQALQLALGASRWDLLRGVAAEVIVLVALGGAAGMVIAWWAVDILTAATPVQLSWMGLVEPSWSPRVYALMVGVVVASVGLASAGPALYVTRIAPAEPLKDSSGTTTGRPGHHFQTVVVAELALAMVLLLSASLITKSARAVAAFEFGYDARSLVQVATQTRVVTTRQEALESMRADTFRALPVGGGRTMELIRPGRAAIAHEQLAVIVARLRSLPDVGDAAWIARGHADRNIVISDATYVLDSLLYKPYVLSIGSGFFSAVGLPIVAGRDFTDADHTGNGAVILDERGAKRLFPNGDAVGRLVKLGPGQSRDVWIPVVGIARNAVHALPAFPELDPEPTVYVSRSQTWAEGLRFVVRPERGAADVRPVASQTVRDLLPPNAAVNVSRWVTTYDHTLASRRYTAGVFSTLGIASLILATAGLFGVLSYSVNQRMREFAVRVALGAQRPHVIRLVLRDGLVMALGGTAVGAAIGMWAAFAVWEWLWGVYPVDATALVAAEAVLLSVTMAAAALPALRATRANPVEVMRAT